MEYFEGHPPESVYLAYVTLPAQDNAIQLAEKLVNSGCVAGVNILGSATSVYAWNGSVHNKPEWIMFAQISAEKLEDFKRELLKDHPYIVPCILALPISAAHKPFVEWIRNPFGGDGK